MEQCWDSAPESASANGVSQCCNACVSRGAKSSWHAKQHSSHVVSVRLGAK